MIVVLFIRRIYIHKAFVQELTEWKEKQAHLLVEFMDNTERRLTNLSRQSFTTDCSNGF